MAAPAIEVRNLSKSFGSIRAVNDLSFEVRRGELMVLLGTSGSGKTTTLKMINRLIEPDSGSVFINGEPHGQKSPEELRRGIGYVMQHIGLFPHFTVAQNISVVPDLLKWDKRKTESRSRELLEKFHLDPDVYLPLYPRQLSGGQKQRVGFARALMANPPVLLMDEPLGALDPVTRIQMRKEFKTLEELRGKTIILVTHDITEAIELGDRISVMDEGRIQQTGTAAELLMHPHNEFTRTFFSNERFSLQLKALKLKDIIPFLKPAKENYETVRISENTSLITVMELLSSAGDQHVTIDLANGSEGKYLLDLTGFFDSIQQLKNKSV